MKALIVDDEQLARERLRHLLQALPEWEAAGEAANGREALEFLDEHRVDAVLLGCRIHRRSSSVRPLRTMPWRPSTPAPLITWSSPFGGSAWPRRWERRGG